MSEPEAKRCYVKIVSCPSCKCTPSPPPPVGPSLNISIRYPLYGVLIKRPMDLQSMYYKVDLGAFGGIHPDSIDPPSSAPTVGHGGDTAASDATATAAAADGAPSSQRHHYVKITEVPVMANGGIADLCYAATAANATGEGDERNSGTAGLHKKMADAAGDRGTDPAHSRHQTDGNASVREDGQNGRVSEGPNGATGLDSAESSGGSGGAGDGVAGGVSAGAGGNEEAAPAAATGGGGRTFADGDVSGGDGFRRDEGGTNEDGGKGVEQAGGAFHGAGGLGGEDVAAGPVYAGVPYETATAPFDHVSFFRDMKLVSPCVCACLYSCVCVFHELLCLCSYSLLIMLLGHCS